MPEETHELNEKEKEIVILLAKEQLRDREIAKRTGLQPGTVRNYIRTIKLKLKLRNRTQIAIYGLQNLLELEEE